jgi:hypothetical protein
MKMTPQSMVELLDTAPESDERLEELGDYIADLADEEKKVNVEVIEALFKIYERLPDPSQSLFNALESCAMCSQEKIVRKLARESALRKPNYCNLQFVGTETESIKVLKKIKENTKLDSELMDMVNDIIQEAEDEQA